MWEGDTIDRILGFVTCRGGTGSCRNKGGGKKGLHLTYETIGPCLPGTWGFPEHGTFSVKPGKS